MTRGLADQQEARRGKAHTGGQHFVSFRTQDLHLSLDECRNLRVGGSEIDTHDQIIHSFRLLVGR